MAIAASACVPTLGDFNAVTPKDRGGVLARRDIVYGPDPRQKLDIYAPRQSPIGMPMVIFFYGGSWNSGERDEYEFLGDALASRGFLTIIPDYRLAPRARFPIFLEDCAAAVRWSVDHGGALGGDPRKLVLMGHSAGAYNAVMLGLDQRYLRGVGVDPVAVRGVAGLSGPYDFLPLDARATREAFAGAPDLAATQPIHFARRDGPALLLLWGDKDATVGRRSIDAMTRAAEAAGESVEAKIYPNLDHAGMLLDISRLLRGNAPVLDDVTAFARRVTA
jgi:acetyl esterase/lipase